MPFTEELHTEFVVVAPNKVLGSILYIYTTHRCEQIRVTLTDAGRKLDLLLYYSGIPPFLSALCKALGNLFRVNLAQSAGQSSFNLGLKQVGAQEFPVDRMTEDAHLTY